MFIGLRLMERLFDFLDFFGDLVGEAFELLALDAGDMGADEVLDCLAGVGSFLRCEKKSGGRAYQCASEGCDNNG